MDPQQILSSVTTPLSLAALVILVLFGAFQGAKRGTSKAVPAQTYWVVLAFGIMGNASYLAHEYLFSDVIIRGEVRDSKGVPLYNTIVDVSSVGRTATNESGTFEISVPYSRQAKDYVVYTFADGIQAAPQAIPGPKPDFVRLQFDPTSDYSDFVNERDVIIIGQNVGEPTITYQVIVDIKKGGRVTYQPYEMRLTTPTGKIVTLFAAATSKGGGYFYHASEPFDVDKTLQNTQLITIATSGVVELTTLFNNNPNISDNGWFRDCLNGFEVNSEEAQHMQEFFDSAFVWTPGRYQLSIKLSVNGKPQEVARSFSISSPDSDRLREMRQRLATCRGLTMDPTQAGTASYADAKAVNYLEVPLGH